MNIVKVRLKRWWAANPPEKVMALTPAEAQVLVNNGTAEYLNPDLNTGAKKRGKNGTQ